MSETPATEAALALRTLAVEHPLGPLRTVRLDATVADRARDLASRMLSGPGPDGPASLARDRGRPPVQDLPPLLDLAGRLLWSRQHDATRAVLQVVRTVGGSIVTDEDEGDDAAAAPWREVAAGYLILTDLTEFGPDVPTTTLPELGRAATALVGAADRYLAAGDHRRAALVASAALWVLFHQELHDARPGSALVDDPDGWLRPLSRSQVGRLLTSPSRRSAERAEPPPGPRTAPLVLSGAYPRFAAPVIEALRAEPGLRVTGLALSEVDKPFRRMAVEPWLVEVRLRAALGETVRHDLLATALEGADTVLADWADAGTMLASLMRPPGTALTVRVHSVDALRCWLHLIDWSAVDQLICVGPHVQDLIDAQLGARVAHVRHTVLPNLVEIGSFDHPRGDDTDHTLMMVGWARAVKDPLWTVELLARLRRHDHRWRLLLVGHPFPDKLPPSGRAYADRFAERAGAPDVREAIEYVRFTDDLAPVLARAGWVVSSSVRESWGVGPMEAVAAGAVPVIRNWPLFARWGGPRRLYPDQWVVDSLDEAERRILQTTAEGRRHQVAETSQALLSDLFDPRAAAAGYREALTLISPDQRGSSV